METGVFKDEVVDYKGGYIVKRVCSKLSCSECLESSNTHWEKEE